MYLSKHVRNCTRTSWPERQPPTLRPFCHCTRQVSFRIRLVANNESLGAQQPKCEHKMSKCSNKLHLRQLYHELCLDITCKLVSQIIENACNNA